MRALLKKHRPELFQPRGERPHAANEPSTGVPTNDDDVEATENDDLPSDASASVMEASDTTVASVCSADAAEHNAVIQRRIAGLNRRDPAWRKARRRLENQLVVKGTKPRRAGMIQGQLGKDLRRQLVLLMGTQGDDGALNDPKDAVDEAMSSLQRQRNWEDMASTASNGPSPDRMRLPASSTPKAPLSPVSSLSDGDGPARRLDYTSWSASSGSAQDS